MLEKLIHGLKWGMLMAAWIMGLGVGFGIVSIAAAWILNVTGISYVLDQQLDLFRILLAA